MDWKAPDGGLLDPYLRGISPLQIMLVNGNLVSETCVFSSTSFRCLFQALLCLSTQTLQDLRTVHTAPYSLCGVGGLTPCGRSHQIALRRKGFVTEPSTVP